MSLLDSLEPDLGLENEILGLEPTELQGLEASFAALDESQSESGIVNNTDVETAAMSSERVSMRRIFWRELKADKRALVSLFVFIGIMLFVFIGAQVVGAQTALRPNIFNLNQPPTWWLWQGGGSPTGGLLGTDGGGRSVAQILLVSARNSIMIGFTVSILSLIIGIVVGLIAGYYGGTTDGVIMRILDTVTIIPTTMIMMVIRIMIVDFTIFHMIGLLLMFSWIGRARYIRNLTMGQRVLDYVSASKTLGTRNPAIIVKKILPNLVAMISAEVVLTLGTSIGMETGLTVLGFGLPIGTPSLGNLISNALIPANMSLRQWNWLPAIVVVFIIMLTINYVGQALSRAANAQQRLSA
jgi:peptide/nickel transport system permease protein